MDYWYKFWQKYRLVEINNENDLLYQVGRTINKKPISKEESDLYVQDIKNKLKLNGNDVLLDLACGNGIITYELSNYVKKVIGVDFSNPLIANAKKYKLSYKFYNQNEKLSSSNYRFDVLLIDESNDMDSELTISNIQKPLKYLKDNK